MTAASPTVDAAIGGQFLRVVHPAAVESAMFASEEEARRKDEVLEALRRDLEAARYAAQRAHKQYDRTDPDNRLVADELERRWNQALERVRALEARIEQHTHDQSGTLAIQHVEFMGLATELEAVSRSRCSSEEADRLDTDPRNRCRRRSEYASQRLSDAFLSASENPHSALHHHPGRRTGNGTMGFRRQWAA